MWLLLQLTAVMMLLLYMKSGVSTCLLLFPSILCFVSDLKLFRMFDHMLEALILLFW